MKLPFSRNYKLVVLNGSLSTVGTSAFQLAVLWIALVLTKSTILAGFADGMAVLPLVFSFVLGAYVDRLVSKKFLAIAVSVFRVASIFGLFLALLINNILVEAASIYFVAFVIGLSTDILNSTRSSWSKQFLDKSQYHGGVSLSQSARAIAEGVGYAISGLLLLMGLNFAVYGFAVIFAVATLPIFFLKNERSTATAKEATMQSSVKKGIEFVFRDSRLRSLLIIILSLNLALGTTGIFIAYLINDRFDLPAIYYTTIALTLTIGIFAGSALGTKARGRVGTYSICLILPVGILLFLIGMMSSVYPDYAIVFGIGLAIGIMNVVIGTAVIAIVDQEMMGRVSGVMNTFGVSLTFVSGAIGGVLIQFVSLNGGFLIIGTIVAIASFLPLFFRDFYNLRV